MHVKIFNLGKHIGKRSISVGGVYIESMVFSNQFADFLFVNGVRNSIICPQVQKIWLERNEIRWIFLTLAVVMLATLFFWAIPLIIILYVILSLINTQFTKHKNEI